MISISPIDTDDILSQYEDKHPIKTPKYEFFENTLLPTTGIVVSWGG
jgi:hypothetical protein